jgi:hypothetical protein
MLETNFGNILGVANKRSIAWATTQALSEGGAHLAFSHQIFQEPPCNMNTWSRSDVIVLITLIFVIVACLAAVFVVPEFRRWLGLDHPLVEKDILVVTPTNKAEIILLANETKPVRRPIVGKIIGYTEEDIERLRLQVEVLIKTDRWYLQGVVPVLSNGKWKLEEGHFGGTIHIIRAILKDKDSRELVSTDIEVTLI